MTRSLRVFPRVAPAIPMWLGLALGLNAASALGGMWSTSGPFPGIVWALGVDSTQTGWVYAGVFDSNNTGGVFRSTNNGAGWTRTGLSTLVTALAVGPDRTVYAGGGAAFKSTDGGETWLQIRPQQAYLNTSFLRIDPRNASTIYLGTSITIVNVGDPSGDLLRSADGGVTWLSIKQGLDGRAVADLAIDPSTSDTLHAVQASGYYRSRDSGVTWIRRVNDLPAAGVSALALDPTMSSTIYAGGSSGFFKSSDGGDSFVRVGAGLPASPITDLLVNPRDPASIYLATRDSGVYASANGGATWTAFNSGLTNLSVRELAIDPTGTFLHAATAAGVFDYQLDTNDTALVLNRNHRFLVRLTARDPRTGRTSGGLAMPLGDLAGYFSIPDLTGSPETPEAFVKVVDGRAVNGAHWVFYGGLTDLEYTLTVTEEATGRVQTYFKSAGSACGGFDTTTFGP